MSTLTLRPYQREWVRGADALWYAGRRRIAGVMATGGGKTPTFSTIADRAVAVGGSVLVLAHRTELIEQAADKMRQVNPAARVGILQGRRKEYRAQVVVASVQTASRDNALTLLRTVAWALIVIDECHHAAADTYVKILRELRAYEANGPLVLGVTATLDRADGLALSSVFEDVITPRIGMIDLIKLGFLLPPRGIRVRVEGLDLGKVREVAGDLDKGALARYMHDALAPAAIARAVLEHAPGRAGVAFMPTVALSKEQADVFNQHGIPAAHVDGAMPRHERARIVEENRLGKTLILCNVDVFTEGTDMPHWSLVIPKMTKSTNSYIQQVGRGVRPHPGQVDCVVLDATGVTGKHRLVTYANLDGAERVEDLDPDLAAYEEDEEIVKTVNDPEPAEPELSQGADGPLHAEMVDLFGASHTAWNQTHAGVWFLSTPNEFVYLWQQDSGCDPGRYVIRWTTRGTGAWGEIPDTRNLELGYAMAWGEQLAARAPVLGLGKDAKWREGKPSATLLRKARAAGIADPSQYNRGRLDDLVNQHEASRLLDSTFRGYVG